MTIVIYAFLCLCFVKTPYTAEIVAFPATAGYRGQHEHDHHDFRRQVVSDSWWKLVFGVAPDPDGHSIMRRGQAAARQGLAKRVHPLEAPFR